MNIYGSSPLRLSDFPESSSSGQSQGSWSCCSAVTVAEHTCVFTPEVLPSHMVVALPPSSAYGGPEGSGWVLLQCGDTGITLAQGLPAATSDKQGEEFQDSEGSWDPS